VNAVLSTASEAKRQVAYFRLADPEKGYFGPKIWVDVFVGSESAIGAAVAASQGVSAMDVDAKEAAASVPATSSAAAPRPRPPSPLNPAIPLPSAAALVDKYALQLQLLHSFGCTNTELNIQLLEKYNGDLKRTYAELTGLQD